MPWPPSLRAREDGGRTLYDTGRLRESIVSAASAREVEVLVAWLHSESKEEAARRLYLGATTVNTHISRIRAKYTAVGRPAPSKAALFVRAIQDGYVDLADW